MIISEDLRSAKQVLSTRLLRLGLQGGAVAMVPTLSVHVAMIMAGKNVHAVGIGRKYIDGKATDQMCVRVHVVQKLAQSMLAPRDVIPSNVDNMPTDVIESPPAFIAATKTKNKKPANVSTTAPCSSNRQTRQRPIVAGISAAHRSVTAGTIAYFCRSTRHGDDPANVYMLSNNHVFADVNQGAVGDDIYQPGPMDGGTATDHAADLHRFVRITLGGTVPNKVDAAIAGLRSDVAYTAQICTIGSLSGSEAATVDTKVRKHGRTTGYTEGEVTDDSYDALVGMDHSNPNVVGLFENQLRIGVTSPYAAFGLGGDSGSLVVHRSKAKAVGLYFAGPPSGAYGIANHIADVLSELEISLL